MHYDYIWGFPGGSAGKESSNNAEDLGSIPGLGRSPGGGHGNPLQYSCLENPHGWRSPAGYSLWGCKDADITEQLSTAQPSTWLYLGLPWWLKQHRICLQCWRPRFHPWVRKILWRREWLPTLVFLPGEFHEQGSLAGYSPQGIKELDTTEWLTLSHYYISHVLFFFW